MRGSEDDMKTGRDQAGHHEGEDAAAGGGIHIRLAASPARKAFAAVVLALIAGLLFYLALGTPPPLPGLLAMLALGAGALWLSARLWGAGDMAVVLNETGLCDSSGAVIAHWDEIESVERGTLAFKPSNGFVLNLHPARDGAGGRGWVPGLWWRIGQRVGVGGVTPAVAGRFMAEQIAARLLERDARE